MKTWNSGCIGKAFAVLEASKGHQTRKSTGGRKGLIIALHIKSKIADCSEVGSSGKDWSESESDSLNG